MRVSVCGVGFLVMLLGGCFGGGGGGGGGIQPTPAPPGPSGSTCGAYTTCGSCVRDYACGWCDGRCIDGSFTGPSYCGNYAFTASECGSTRPPPSGPLSAPSNVTATDEFVGQIGVSFSAPAGAQYFRLFGRKVLITDGGHPPPVETATACEFTNGFTPIPNTPTVYFQNNTVGHYWFWVQVARDANGTDHSGANPVGARGGHCHEQIGSPRFCHDPVRSNTFRAVNSC